MTPKLSIEFLRIGRQWLPTTLIVWGGFALLLIADAIWRTWP